MSFARAIRSRIERFVSPAAANFWCHVIEGGLATFGEGLVVGQLFAVLVTALGGSGATLGVLTSIGSFTVVAPLLFAPRVEAVRRKKRLVLLLGLGQRLPHLLIVAVLVLLAKDRPIACLYAIALMNLLRGISTSVMLAPWQDLIAETVPIQRVGRLFGFRNFLSSVLRLPAAVACGAVIAYFAFPTNYQLLYLFSFIITMASLGIFALVDELPESVAPKARQRAGHYFRNLIAALRDDGNYRRFVLYRIFTKASDPVLLFFALAAVRSHGMKEASWVALSGAAASVAVIVGSLLLPFVAERIGPKRMLAASVSMRAGVMVLAALAPSGGWLIAAFLLIGLCQAAHSVAEPPFMMRVFPRGKRVGYMTLLSVAMAPLRITIPLAAGLISQVFGFSVLFAATGAFILAGLLPLRKIVLAPIAEESQGASGEQGPTPPRPS